MLFLGLIIRSARLMLITVITIVCGAMAAFAIMYLVSLAMVPSLSSILLSSYF